MYQMFPGTIEANISIFEEILSRNGLHPDVEHRMIMILRLLREIQTINDLQVRLLLDLDSLHMMDTNFE